MDRRKLHLIHGLKLNKTLLFSRHTITMNNFQDLFLFYFENDFELVLKCKIDVFMSKDMEMPRHVAVNKKNNFIFFA